MVTCPKQLLKSCLSFPLHLKLTQNALPNTDEERLLQPKGQPQGNKITFTTNSENTAKY